jgi:hypothetical protein
MKRMRIVGLSLVAAFALSAIGAVSASALPEIGRCVSQVGGKYTEGNCIKKGTTKEPGSFEWKKNPIKKGFTSVGGEGKLQGATGTEIKCLTQSATGVYLEKGATPSTKEVTNVQATFKGCELPLFGVECKSAGHAAGEIVTTKLKGKLSYTSGKKTPAVKVNQGLSPIVKKKGFTEFECPAVGVVVYVGEGPEKGHETILANIGPLNSMGTTATETYEGSGGTQTPNFVEGKSLVIDNLESSLSGPKGTFERSDQVLTTVITNEEALEIKA